MDNNIQFNNSSILEGELCNAAWKYIFNKTKNKLGKQMKEEDVIQIMKNDILPLSMIPRLCKYVDKSKQLSGDRLSGTGKRERVILFYKFIMEKELNLPNNHTNEQLIDIISLLVDVPNFKYKKNIKKLTILKELLGLVVILGKLSMPFLQFFK
jgi:hypothetical protein